MVIRWDLRATAGVYIPRGRSAGLNRFPAIPREAVMLVRGRIHHDTIAERESLGGRATSSVTPTKRTMWMSNSLGPRRSESMRPRAVVELSGGTELSASSRAAGPRGQNLVVAELPGGTGCRRRAVLLAAGPRGQNSVVAEIRGIGPARFFSLLFIFLLLFFFLFFFLFSSLFQIQTKSKFHTLIKCTIQNYSVHA